MLFISEVFSYEKICHKNVFNDFFLFSDFCNSNLVVRLLVK